MTGALDQLAQDYLWHGFMVFLRISALCFLLPVFGEQSIPARVKLAIAIAFSFIIIPSVPLADIQPTFLHALAIGGTEILIGLFLGISLRLFVIALQIAGSIAAQSTSLSQLFGGAASDPMPAMGHLLVISGLALATLFDLHLRCVEFMLYSYALIPAGSGPGAEQITELGIDHLARCFALGFSIAGPFFIASLIYNVTLGVINKAMPQLMVAFVGAPAITAGGLILLMLAAPILLSVWLGAYQRFLMSPFGAPG